MPAAPSTTRTHWPAYAALAALFLLAAGAFTQRAYDTFDLQSHAREYARPPFYLGDANWGAVVLQPEAEATGMKFGDAVLSVNGRPVDGFVVYYGLLRRAAPGDRLEVQVQSPGDGTGIRNLSIELRPYQGASDPPIGFSEYLGTALRMVAFPVVCLALGFWVAAVRIGDRSAWLFLVLLIGLPASFGGGAPETLFGRGNVLQPLLTGFSVLSSQIALPALMLFGIAFPERLPLDRRVPWLKWIVAGYLLLVAGLVAVAVGLWLHHVELARRLTGRAIILLTGLQGDFGAAVGGLAVVICALSLGWKAMTAPSRDARRRLMLLFAGATPGVTALLILLVANRLEYTLPSWTLLPLVAMMFAFPLTMAYVIVVHRAMDVRVVIRQGLQYLLARGGIRAIQLGLLAAVTIAATSVLSGGAGFARVAAVIAGMAAMVAIGSRFTDQLRRSLDRRFFREAYETDAILSDLAMQVRTMIETGPLLETVATRIAASLHVPRVAILLDGGGIFQPAYSLGYDAPPRVALPAESVTIARLRRQPHALVQPGDEDSWVRSTTGDERRSLDALQPELLLPLSLNDKILGIISLGPKQSEEPYSTTDIRLLDSVAAQTGLALENGRLTAAVAAEVAARAKQTRDIEIARDVQQRLFPQEYPPIAGLDYAGGCRAALGVGGDYYDFIVLSPTHLGIAIGDVSGKGIPASLLMASLRAFLRGAQTVHRQADLTEVMRNLNKLVYQSSDSNRYATFFYGELDLASRTMTYVNAGHNPPMLFRSSTGDGEVVRLDAGGPVIGLIEECLYQQASVTLAAGDVLVAYTDGVSEAMNGTDEEWGEDRLMAAVWPHCAEPARALIDRLMSAADTFVAGAPQHDDMTLLVVRAVARNGERR
jgi:sigma-B regulation protein RsbU (phosphoserine phosphatase)